MKITLIGPSYPFRGGISHYNTLLFRTLRKKYDVQFLGYSRQFPAFLYPGKSDREEGNKQFFEPDVDRIIDTLNPLTWIKALSKLILFKPHFVILPWWVVYFAPLYAFLIPLIKFFSKGKIIFLCHNVVEHESSFIKQLLTRMVLKQGNYYIVHSEQERDKLMKMGFKSKKIKKIFHPTYEELNPEILPVHKAKENLGLEGKKVILFFGFIRPYKGLIYLLEAMKEICEVHKEIHLIVVGEFMKENKDDYLDIINHLRSQECLSLHDYYVPSSDINKYFSAADLVVLPYVSATQSGIVQIAYSYAKPVIVTNVGGLPEVVVQDKSGFVVPPKDSGALRRKILDYFNLSDHEYMTNYIMEYKRKFAWEHYYDVIREIAEDEKVKLLNE